MNLFLVDTDYDLSAEMLAKADPRRARKQLLECCQILASVDYHFTGDTCYVRKDGTKYKAAHPNHPITVHCRNFYQYDLCREIARSLTLVFPKHACSKAFNKADDRYVYNTYGFSDNRDYVVCRKHLGKMFVKTKEEYVEVMRTYLEIAKGMKF